MDFSEAPTGLPEGLASVIVLGHEMDKGLVGTYPSALAGAATGREYSHEAATVMQTAAYIRALGYRAVASMNDTALVIPYALKAGLGEYARNQLVITPETGPRLRFSKIFTDLPLAQDAPRKLGVAEFCSICTRCADACPVKALWKTVEASKLKGRRNGHEDALLYRLYEVFPEGVKVTVVADRGFADCSLFEHLARNLGFEYVIRLRGNIYVTNAKGEKRKASQWVGVGGRSRTLRDAVVTDSNGLEVGTAGCVQDKEMKEPWCLVASERKAATRTLIRYYAKRWGIETSFRDIKDMRFGMGLSAMRLSKPERTDRMLLLSALAIALLTLLGAAGECLGYDRWLKANTVKYRTHSWFRQGLMLYEHIPNWPEHRLRPLMDKFAQMLMEQRVCREVFGVI